MTTLLKHLTALAAAATMMLAVSAPARAQLGDLKFGSYKVTSVVPTSFTSLDVTGHAALESVSSLFALVRNPTIDPAAYTDENVSTKVVKIIQSYVGIVNKMVWRKDQ